MPPEPQIVTWQFKTKNLFGEWQDNTRRYTTDASIALSLATHHVPGLAFAFLKHPNGMWSLAASDDGVPKYDGSMFEEQYLALSIVATVFETLVDRAARQQ